jgi:hypothetical protein
MSKLDTRLKLMLVMTVLNVITMPIILNSPDSEIRSLWFVPVLGLVTCIGALIMKMRLS